MNVEIIKKETFAVIGKQGSTDDGKDFIKDLWKEANEHFLEVESLAKKDEEGKVAGIWGVMSDFSLSFKPWKDFKKGLYLAGIECEEDKEAPKGWVKWIVPGFEYICIENENKDSFKNGIKYLKDNNYNLVGAVHDYYDSQTNKNYIYYPIKKL